MEIVKNIVNIVNILHDMDYNNVYDYRNTIICIDEIGLNVYGNNFRTTVDINKSIGNLIDRIKDISDEIEFVAYEDMKDIRISDVLKNGKYWKENKMIDSCENKDKICKSRAECMREITEQNRFNVEEEFKKICIKERENILESIHKAIEDKAKRGYNSINETYVRTYMSKDFRVIDYGSPFYSIKCDFLHKTVRWDFLGQLSINDKINLESYIWKFVDKLNYETSRKISIEYIYEWIIRTLKVDEGFNVWCEDDYNKFTISW